MALTQEQKNYKYHHPPYIVENIPSSWNFQCVVRPCYDGSGKIVLSIKKKENIKFSFRFSFLCQIHNFLNEKFLFNSLKVIS